MEDIKMTNLNKIKIFFCFLFIILIKPVILAGLTANRGQPYYEAYLWAPDKNHFVHNNEITEAMPNLCIDTEKQLLYSFYMMNDGRKEYRMFKFDGGHYIEINCLQKFNYIFDYPVYLYENENFDDNNCNFKKFQDLSEEWKRVISISINDPENVPPGTIIELMPL